MRERQSMLLLYNICHFQRIIHRFHRNNPLYLKAVALHADLVFRNEVGAVLLGVFGVREEHAFVALGFLVGADAAGLDEGQRLPLGPFDKLIPSASQACLGSSRLRPGWRRSVAEETVLSLC